MSDSGKLIVVSGPSGVGKSTVVREVLKRTGADFSISATTRQPREGEIDGKHYHFTTREDFQKMIDAGELLEWADVFGNFYGTPAGPVRQAVDAGRKIILEIDVQGGVQVHEKLPDATFVLVVPPSEEVLRNRLAGRGTEDEESFNRRFGKAQEELRIARESGAYSIELVNDELEAAICELIEIVIK